MKRILGATMVAGLVIGGIAGCATSKGDAPAVQEKAAVTQQAPVAPRPVAQAPVLDGTYSYRCEQGKKVTVVHKKEQRDVITLRWNNKDHELKREATTTGANRFEDKKAGLVWINIPTKSILLDARKGRQLANECRS